MKDNWIYKNTKDNSARFILGEYGEKMLACFGINSSTATPEKLDPTLTRVKQRALKNAGYDGWMMFNVYPQRATDPNNLHLQIDSELHQQNLETINNFFSENNCDIWAAWGTLINKRLYLKNCLFDIYNVLRNKNWYSIGKKSKDGHPHHPLYVSYSEKILPFEIDSYITKLKKG